MEGCVPEALSPESECLNLHKNNWMQYLAPIILAILFDELGDRDRGLPRSSEAR